MTFKIGLGIGLAVGYYYGAKAGRERFEAIDAYLQPVRDSDAWRQLQELARGLADEVVLTTRQALKDATAPDTAVVDLRRAS